MQIFISGTDTDVGKTIISSWICLHTAAAYFKPIQTGSLKDTDSAKVYELSSSVIYPEIFIYQKPVAPYLAAKLEKKQIDINKIKIPTNDNLIIEGAGGLLVPINNNYLMIDLIKKLKLPVILVAKSVLGTINHTLLSLEALRKRKIPILGIILNGTINNDNKLAIEHYGNTNVLAEFPYLNKVDTNTLKDFKLPYTLEQAIRSEKIKL